MFSHALSVASCQSCRRLAISCFGEDGAAGWHSLAQGDSVRVGPGQGGEMILDELVGKDVAAADVAQERHSRGLVEQTDEVMGDQPIKTEDEAEQDVVADFAAAVEGDGAGQDEANGVGQILYFPQKQAKNHHDR